MLKSFLQWTYPTATLVRSRSSSTCSSLGLVSLRFWAYAGDILTERRWKSRPCLAAKARSVALLTSLAWHILDICCDELTPCVQKNHKGETEVRQPGLGYRIIRAQSQNMLGRCLPWFMEENISTPLAGEDVFNQGSIFVSICSAYAEVGATHLLPRRISSAVMFLRVMFLTRKMLSICSGKYNMLWKLTFKVMLLLDMLLELFILSVVLT